MSTPDLKLQNPNAESMNWHSLSPELRELIKAIATPEEIHLICEKNVAGTAETMNLQQRIIKNIRVQGNHDLSIGILNFMLSQKQQSIFVGPQHTSTLETTFELAQELGVMGSYTQAEEVWIRLLGLYEELGIDDKLKVMYNLAVIFNQDKKYAEAEYLLKQVVPQIRDAMGKESQQSIGTLRELSVALGGQHRYEEAKSLNIQGLKELDENQKISIADKQIHIKANERVRVWLDSSVTDD